MISASLVIQAEYNMDQRKILLSLAKVEMRRQELRQQAKEVREEGVVTTTPAVLTPVTGHFDLAHFRIL